MAVPRATYRLQLRGEFGFDDVAAIADYLAALGVSHVYTSPYLQAAPGSSHGYDVVDPQRVNAELGGADAHARMSRRLGEVGLGQVLDIVPNHMAITQENAWWWDVLEDGPASVYATFFDVDWDPPESKLRNTVLLPVLGDQYGRVLESGDLRLGRDGGAFVVRYFDHAFPLAPRSLDAVLGPAAARLGDVDGADDLAFLAASHARLPHATATDRDSVAQRHRDKSVLRRQLERLCADHPAVAAAVDAVVAETNADPDALDALLDRQNYRLAFWRTAGRELDYRRFFDITTLAAMRTEDEHVFEATHALVLQWLRDGVLDGVRVDHIDGLRDPERYLRRLHEAAPTAWVVVEKILEPGERLPASWLVAGTTGYDFLNHLGGLFVDPVGEAALTELFTDLTGLPGDYEQVAREAKVQVMADVLASDISRLVQLLVQVCERHRRHRDYTRHDLEEALVELIANFDVYRTYVRADDGRVHETDTRRVEEAAAAATTRRPDLDAELFAFLRDLLLLRVGTGDAERELVMRFQQVTGPVMAKGVEDTAFYRYFRLSSLNEVGGDPGRFGVGVDEFHGVMAANQADWPNAMLASSTHDTKRSEDVRARIALLSEIPDRWAAAVRGWSAHNDRYRRGPDRPDGNTEYLLYQTLVGAHPLPVERALTYIEKASREAKMHTSWVDPDGDYDDALRAFVEGVLADEEFTSSLDDFVAPLIEPGWVNSLAATLVKLTAPGVPDIYQGSELWDLSLVDPDNRRPVDYGERRRLVADLESAAAEDVWKRADEGLPKLHVVQRALDVRTRLPEVFGPGSSYQPLAGEGGRAHHAVGFVRGDRVATVVPRLVLGLGAHWSGTTIGLPAGTWRNELTGDVLDGGAVDVAGLLGRFPVALLVREDA